MQLRKRHRKSKIYTRHCWYCGLGLRKATATRDHQVPICKGGSEANGNIVWSCERCNNQKANLDVGGYRQVLEQRAGKPVVFYGERV